MNNLIELRRQLELAFARYTKLDDDERQKAMDMAVLMLRQMLLKQSRKQKRLTELKDDATKRGTSTTSEKVRRKLVRKTNAASPKAPIKPVQVTKKNELRRK